jgi:hypothetical protein
MAGRWEPNSWIVSASISKAKERFHSLKVFAAHFGWFSDDTQTTRSELLLVSLHLLGPEFVPDLREWLIVEVRNVVKATIDRRDLVFG